jgi:hypothetical protein
MVVVAVALAVVQCSDIGHLQFQFFLDAFSARASSSLKSG